MNYVDFFSNLGFDFNSNLKSKVIDFEKEVTLSQKLKNSVFFYKSPNNTNTSFYLVTTSLEHRELEVFRKYVWNKNDADIIFHYPNEGSQVKMLYGKYSPKVSNEDSELEVFFTNAKDLQTIENIKKWNFDSGVFWHNYLSFIDKAKYKGIDKELVFVLDALKMKLANLLSKIISDEKERQVTVQALIDRTLYIKYLEDRHIINSYFYNHHFNNDKLNYEKLLASNSNTDINKLYKIIHEIFNNALFDLPTIEDRYLTREVCTLIANSFNHNINTGQLRLFDFSFDVLPVEFISYIYEVFLSEQQKANGIYYTPKKLAQLIVDDVMPEGSEIGSILDPSCGSGMFLIVGFQRLLEIAKRQKKEPKNNIDKIRFRLQLLSENIFGIEKQVTAKRFTLFSLSLQIFDGIDADEIKRFIANELKKNNRITLFNEFSFHDNIIHQNTLDLKNNAFESKKFSYIIGNPPFVGKEVSEDAKYFTNNYEINLTNKKIIAKDIIDGYQISQCFLLIIKEWSNEDTRLGFISNSSNFYNESQKFQKFFYSNYGIEKIYELSRVKKILFENADESIIAIIFTNVFQNNIIDYYPIEKGIFSEKPFELLIIQEDKIIEIVQEKLINYQIRLRDFLVGNEYDRNLLLGLKNRNYSMDNILDGSQNNYRGLERIENKRLSEYLKIDIQSFSKLSIKQKNYFHLQFANERYLAKEYIENYSIPYLYSAKKLHPFWIEQDLFIKQQEINRNNFRRLGAKKSFGKKKILLNRFGDRINAAYVESPIAYSTYLYCLILKDDNHYHFISALLNSDLCNYYIHLFDRKRVDSNYSNIDLLAIRNIPLPKDLDKDLINNISDISKGLSEGQYEYIKKEQELNELIYDLYELSYWEKQRIKDYFLPKAKIKRNENSLSLYKNTLKEIIGFYFESPIALEESSTDFNLIVLKMSFKNNLDNPKVAKTKKYLLNEIFEQNPNANFLTNQEKIFGKDCVYIIKEDLNKNWTETKAFEDGQDILKHLIPNENGERIH